MNVADHEDGSHCGVQDPYQDCEEEADGGDLRSSTGWAGGGGSNVRWVEYTDPPPLDDGQESLFHVKLSAVDNVVVSLR